MKWAFLLKMDSPSRGGEAFYEFVPYTYGPYSFGMTRDVNALASAGRLTASDKSWTLGPEVEIPPLPTATESDVKRIVERFRTTPQRELVRQVYRAYAAYTVNSNIERLAVRTVAPPAVYTVGYEGRQLDGLLDLLVQTGIRRLADVRRNPVSRRFGFHKSTLSTHCAKLDIEYVHLPELGIASEERSHLSSTRDYAAVFARYERETLPIQAEAVARVAGWMRESATAVMCMERAACECHRGRLANRIHALTELPVIHLQ